jgi:hypothetical protein
MLLGKLGEEADRTCDNKIASEAGNVPIVLTCPAELVNLKNHSIT